MADADKETIRIPPILLEWSKWTAWSSISRVTIPKVAGVYEVKYADQNKRLTIGKALNLRRRIKQQLVRGKKHSSGKKILANEDVSRIVVRWATTDRCAAAEEELHEQHRNNFDELPEYTKHT